MALTIKQRDETLAALKATEWHIRKAAEILGIDRINMHCRIRKLKLRREDFFPRKNNFNRQKTHCKRGHKFTARNTYIRPGTNFRTCRTCEAARSIRKFREIRKAEREANRIPNHPLYYSGLGYVYTGPLIANQGSNTEVSHGQKSNYQESAG